MPCSLSKFVVLEFSWLDLFVALWISRTRVLKLRVTLRIRACLVNSTMFRTVLTFICRFVDGGTDLAFLELWEEAASGALETLKPYFIIAASKHLGFDIGLCSTR